MTKQKSILAVAVAAMALPSLASAVEFTPYIKIDASIGYADSDSTPGQQQDFDYYDSNISSSVYGARASHEISEGLTIKGWVEGDLNSSTGDNNADGIFRREANVGLAGAFGEVSVGTRVNPLLIFNGATFAMAGNSSSTITSIALGYADFFVQKSVTYIAPKMGGFSGQVMYGFEDTDGTGPQSSRESLISGYAKYDFGPAWLGASAQHVEGMGEIDADPATNTAAGGSDTYLIGAGTELAGFTVKASFMSNEEEAAPGSGAEDSEVEAWHLGTSYAFSPAVKVGVDYVQDDEGSSLTHLRGQLSLSKNLTFYTMVNWVDNSQSDGGSTFHQLWGNGTNLARGPIDDSKVAVATGMIVSF